MFSYLYVIIVGVIIQLIGPCTTKLSEPPCCIGKNIIEGHACMHNGQKSRIMLECEYGKHMLDPSVNEEMDNYTIDKFGDMIIQSSDETIPRYGYCTTNYLPFGGNYTKKVALICFDGSHQQSLIIFLVKGVLMFISVIFLIFTLIIYGILPELRDTQDKVTCMAIFCLLLFLFLLGVLQVVHSREILSVCVPFVYVIYFFTIAYFSWLNLIMLNVWKTSVLPRWTIKESTWFKLNHLYGWTIPIALCTSVFVCEHLDGGFKPGFGINSCWFNDNLEKWVFFYLPITILLFINLILFLWSVWGIHRHGNDISMERKRVMAYKCKLYLKLFILAGLNWTLEVLSYHFGSPYKLHWFWILADLFNALHGVLIFCVLIIWRRRVRRELAGKKILCFKGPERWVHTEHNEEAYLRDQDEDNTKCDFTIT